MDIEFMKSSAEDQMEMILMEMQKLPEFSPNYSDDDINNNNNPIIQFSNNTPSNNNNYNNLENPPTFMNHHPNSTISFSGDSPPPYPAGRWKSDAYSGDSSSSSKRNSMAAMREMIFRIAAMQPIHIDPESVKPPKRRNVKISSDPQSVAARHRRERISERIRILQRLVPGGTKMDTASMLDEAIHYVKFLKNQVQSLERVAATRPAPASGVGFPVPMTSGSSYFPVGVKGYHHHPSSSGNHLQH